MTCRAVQVGFGGIITKNCTSYPFSIGLLESNWHHQNRHEERNSRVDFNDSENFWLFVLVEISSLRGKKIFASFYISNGQGHSTNDRHVKSITTSSLLSFTPKLRKQDSRFSYIYIRRRGRKRRKKKKKKKEEDLELEALLWFIINLSQASLYDRFGKQYITTWHLLTSPFVSRTSSALLLRIYDEFMYQSESDIRKSSNWWD